MFPDQAFGAGNAHCALAWYFWGAYGLFDNNGSHRSGAQADAYWQGRSGSQLKLGSNGGLAAGTNYTGVKYKALVLTFSGMCSQSI